MSTSSTSMGQRMEHPEATSAVLSNSVTSAHTPIGQGGTHTDADSDDELQRIYHTANKTSIMHSYNKKMIIALLRFRLYRDTPLAALTEKFRIEKRALQSLREELQDIVRVVVFNCCDCS